jgi:hypothetical protein
MVAHTCDVSYAKSFLLGRKIMVQDQPVQKQDPNWKLTIAKKKKISWTPAVHVCNLSYLGG